jgi:REP element-mobilizing transposase RayT
MRHFYILFDPKGLSPLDKEVIDLEKARTCALQANYHLIWAIKYRRKVLDGSVRVRLEELLKVIAEQNGCLLLVARVHDCDHVHVFICPLPSVSILPQVTKQCGFTFL